jgi:hypothetical protein
MSSSKGSRGSKPRKAGEGSRATIFEEGPPKKLDFISDPKHKSVSCKLVCLGLRLERCR